MGGSIAWRVFDAQFWGVPQRRRRIALVADFGGATAPEILFERKGVFGDITQSSTPWKDFAAAIAERFGGANQTERKSGEVVVFNGESVTSPINKANPKSGDPCHTLNATGAGRCYCLQGNGIDRAAFNQGENAQYDFKVDDEGVNSTIVSKGPSAVCYGVVSKGNGDAFVSEEKHTSLSTGGWQAGQGYPCVMATQQGGAEIRTDGKVPTLTAAAGMSGNNQPVYANASSTVRRLTPLECERLQDFPDGWTDIGNYTDTNGKKRKTSDSARYKALGNSIALPSWAWLLKRLNRYCNEHTMASLFDGIGGFPLIWETLNGKGSCVWASEIEEFPIAVTKYHFTRKE